MNTEIAKNILELNNDSPGIYPSVDEIKKQYRFFARQYHPDKNKDNEENKRFYAIKEAYDYLMSMSPENNADFATSKINQNMNVDILLTQFLESKFFDHDTIKIIRLILLKMQKYMLKNNYVLQPDKKKHIVLRPSINDLLENNLYKLVLDEKEYIIPLWHHELVYEHFGKELIVSCSPVLEKNISIDDKNNIIVDLTFSIKQIFEKESFNVTVGKQTFIINSSELKIKKEQKITIYKKGISKINGQKIYDFEKKANIIIRIVLHL
jgi:hypothetical protein